METNFFLELSDNANDAIIARDLTGMILYWNKAAEKLFGYRSEEVVGQSDFLAVPEARKTEESRLIENLLWGETIENFDTERISRSGELLQVSITTKGGTKDLSKSETRSFNICRKQWQKGRRVSFFILPSCLCHG